jgi:hypothetical protein
MATDNKYVKGAIKKANEKFAEHLAKLSQLPDEKVTEIINSTDLKKESLEKILEIIKDATKSNAQKAAAIKNVSKGIDFLTSIAKKLI